MDLGFSYIISKSEMGFRNYIKHMLSRIETLAIEKKAVINAKASEDCNRRFSD